MDSTASWRLVMTGVIAGHEPPFLVKGDTIVGRSKQADLRIREGFVSRRHARLWIKGGQLLVEDLGSANGTFVNGRKLRGPGRLEAGDRVTFDECEYRVEAVDATVEVPRLPRVAESDHHTPRSVDALKPGGSLWTPATPPADEPDFDLTGETQAVVYRRFAPIEGDPEFDISQLPLLEPDDAARAHDRSAAKADLTPVVARPLDSRSAPLPSRIAPELPLGNEPEPSPSRDGAAPLSANQGDTPALLGLTPPAEGHLFQLVQGRVLLGRGKECDIVLDAPAVSRRHAEIRIGDDCCRLYTLPGAVGTLLNGKPVTEAELLPDDVLNLGGVELVFGSFGRLTADHDPRLNLPPWLWALIGFCSAGTVLALLFLFVF